MTARYAILPDRALIGIEGPDARNFLQGIITNDVTRIGPDRAIYAALLTPQGKFLHEFIMVEMAAVSGGTLLVDCEAARRDDLVRRLTMYRLRAKATIAPRDDLTVAAGFGEGALSSLDLPDEPGAARALDGGVAATDPRLSALGARLYAPPAALEALGLPPATAEEYDALRLTLGIPAGSRDLGIEKATLLDNNFEELNGVDWKKGCYVGQEVTARVHYRGLIRKRLLPVRIEGPMPAPGEPVTAGEKEVGEMRSVREGGGLALLRLDALDGGAPLHAGDATITPQVPDWLASSLEERG
jgi:folate-binding protein YgfZ